jgi:hypothetical protein
MRLAAELGMAWDHAKTRRWQERKGWHMELTPSQRCTKHNEMFLIISSFKLNVLLVFKPQQS